MFGASVEIKTPTQLAHMERAGHTVARMLGLVREAIAPGITTKELDRIAYEYLEEQGATPNFLGYYGYPATLCISVNDRVVHGIPDRYALREGDVVSVDGGCFVTDETGTGWHGDSAFTVTVGESSALDRILVETTETALWAALAALANGSRLGAVGRAVEGVVERNAKRTGQRLTIVREYVGHGIGTAMHLPPDVPNFVSRDKGPRLKPGMAFAIEPIIVAGSQATRILDDEWTVVTLDGSHAAHWEHTVAIVEGGVRVLTALDGGVAGLAPYGVIPATIP
ncbi:MAG TPA: type I methionyl aminopeptidase [Actinomycetaceae bacterium]|nr:type I methionyl aminopeptidase [Actinomycetaceae bacterium]